MLVEISHALCLTHVGRAYTPQFFWSENSK